MEVDLLSGEDVESVPLQFEAGIPGSLKHTVGSSLFPYERKNIKEGKVVVRC